LQLAGVPIFSLQIIQDMASAEPMVEDFLYEVKQLERQEEIKRVLRTLKLNPFELLGVSFEADADEVGALYQSVCDATCVQYGASSAIVERLLAKHCRYNGVHLQRSRAHRVR